MPELIILILIMGLAAWYWAHREYLRGVQQGQSDKEMYGKQLLAEQAEKLQWVYDDSSIPLWRYSKVTGDVQRRFTQPSSLSKTVFNGVKFTEWRSVASKEVVMQGGKEQ